MVDRGLGRHQLIGLVLGEVADLQLRAAAELAGQRLQPASEQLGERGLAVAVGAEQGDAVIHVDAKKKAAKHCMAVIAHGNTVEGQDGRGDLSGLGEIKMSGRILHHGLDGRQLRDRL